MGVNREIDKDNLKDLVFTFTRNLPKSITEEMQMYMSAGGEISQSTLMSLVSFIDNPRDEMKRIQSEEEEKIKRSDELMYNDEQNEGSNIEQSTSNDEE